MTWVRCIIMKGKKFDNGKPSLGLVPGIAITEIAKVLDFGAKKYDRYNWAKGMKWSRLYDASLRHLFAWIDKNSIDEETNLSHLSHSACCIMFLIVYEKLGLGEDDRYELQKNDNNDATLTSTSSGDTVHVVDMSEVPENDDIHIYKEEQKIDMSVLSRIEQIEDAMRHYNCSKEQATSMVDNSRPNPKYD